MSRQGLDKDGFPNEDGIYLVEGWGNEEKKEIEVYEHPIKGLCCYADDFGSGGTGVDDEIDCHVSVQFTGLEFITKIKDLGK